MVRIIWNVIGAVVVLVAAAIFTLFVVSTKNVDYYYVSHGSGDRQQNVTCAYAHWTWHMDELAYCSDDRDKVLDFIAKANASIVVPAKGK